MEHSTMDFENNIVSYNNGYNAGYKDGYKAMELKSCGQYSADYYQILAARTMGNIGAKNQEMHALHGMVGEIGELHSIYQKVYQGHEFDKVHAEKELGDLLWFIAEYCTATGVKLSDIMKMNIEKLKARYPDGFDAEHSLHRKEGDI